MIINTIHCPLPHCSFFLFVSETGSHVAERNGQAAGRDTGAGLCFWNPQWHTSRVTRPNAPKHSTIWAYGGHSSSDHHSGLLITSTITILLLWEVRSWMKGGDNSRILKKPVGLLCKGLMVQNVYFFLSPAPKISLHQIKSFYQWFFTFVHNPQAKPGMVAHNCYYGIWETEAWIHTNLRPC